MSPSRRIHSPAFKVKLVQEALALPAACRIKPTCRKYPGVEPTQLRKWIKALDKLQAQAREESWKTAMLGSITTEAPASDLHSFQKLLESEPALGPVPATAFWQPALRACEEGEGGCGQAPATKPRSADRRSCETPLPPSRRATSPARSLNFWGRRMSLQSSSGLSGSSRRC